MGRLDLEQALAVGLALLLVLAPALGVGVVEVAAQGQGPPDHAGVPSSQVEVRGDRGGGTPDRAAAWGVGASAHASDLSVTIETGSGVTLTLTDDVNSDGREVSINASAMEQEVGERPTTAYGVNSETGERWSSPVRYEDGAAVIEVPHFSTNTVTFSGSVSVSGTFSNGEQSTYTLNSPDSVSNISVDLTGRETTETDTFGVPKGGSSSDTISGDETPASANVDLSWDTQGIDENSGPRMDPSDNTYSQTYSGVTDPGQVQSTFSATVAGSFDFRVIDRSDGSVMGEKTYTSGTSTTATFDFSSQTTPDGIKLVWDNSDNDYEIDIQGHEIEKLPPDSVDVTVDGSTKTWTSEGSKTISLDGDESISASTTVTGGGNGVSTTVSYQETSYTTDPSLSVNGEQVASHSGTLSPGSTVSFSTDGSMIKDGQNNITASTSSTSDAPPQVVEVDYSHSAEDQVSVEHNSSAWRESFNVSRTFVDGTTDASLTTSLSDNVVKIETAEYRVDGGAWSTISDYSLEGSTFTARFATISSNSTVDVYVVARKVQVSNGDIVVEEPTLEGDTLDTLITVENPGAGFSIEVSNTSQGDRLHYAANPSYDARDYTTLGPEGGQSISLPEANDGSQTRIRTAPISLDPEGEIEAVVVDADEPRFSLREGNTSGADVVGVTYYDTVSGERYVLHSETRDRDTDADTAESPVVFQAPGADATYTILQEDGGGAGPVVSVDGSGGGLPLGIIALVGSISVGMVGLAYAGRRWLGARGAGSTALLLVGGGVLGFIGVEAVTGRSVLSDLVFAIGQALGRTGSGFATSGIGSILLSVGGLLGLWLLDRATGWVPTWLFYASGAGLALYTVESIAPGTLTSGLSEVSPLLWLLGGLALIVVLWRRSAGPSITVVGGDDDGS